MVRAARTVFVMHLMHNLRPMTLRRYPTEPKICKPSPERSWIRTYPVNVNKPWDYMGEYDENRYGDETRLPVDVGNGVDE